VEGSYRPNDVQNEYGVFCNQNDTSNNVSTNFKKGLLCIHIFNYELQYNFLWKPMIQRENFQNSKEGDQNYYKFKNERLM